jgi:hypothetical protein
VHGHEVLVGRGSEREGMPLVLRDVPLGSYKTNTKKRKTKQKSGMHVLNFFILIVVYIVNVIWDGIEQVREGKREGGEERIGVKNKERDTGSSKTCIVRVCTRRTASSCAAR